MTPLGSVRSPSRPSQVSVGSGMPSDEQEKVGAGSSCSAVTCSSWLLMEVWGVPSRVMIAVGASEEGKNFFVT